MRAHCAEARGSATVNPRFASVHSGRMTKIFRGPRPTDGRRYGAAASQIRKPRRHTPHGNDLRSDASCTRDQQMTPRFPVPGLARVVSSQLPFFPLPVFRGYVPPIRSMAACPRLLTPEYAARPAPYRPQLVYPACRGLHQVVAVVTISKPSYAPRVVAVVRGDGPVSGHRAARHLLFHRRPVTACSKPIQIA